MTRTLHLIAPTGDRYIGDLGSDAAYEVVLAWLLWQGYTEEVALEMSAWSDKAKVGTVRILDTVRAEVLDTPVPIPPWTFKVKVEPGSTLHYIEGVNQNEKNSSVYGGGS